MCTKCGLHPSRSKHSWCKGCLLQSAKKWREEYKAKTTPEERTRKNKSYMLKTKYEMTLDEYEKRLNDQNHRCKICGNTWAGGPANVFSVDHDHKTGQVRGLLCMACNILIGMAKDSTEILQNAIQYLGKTHVG